MDGRQAKCTDNERLDDETQNYVARWEASEGKPEKQKKRCMSTFYIGKKTKKNIQ